MTALTTMAGEDGGRARCGRAGRGVRVKPTKPRPVVWAQLRMALCLSPLHDVDVGKRLDVHRNTVANWRNGRTLPDLAVAVKLAAVLGLSLNLENGDEA